MIVFDLLCRQNHVFEGWFGSSTDYDDQRRRGLLSCPICGAGEIDKAVMSPRIGAKGNQQSERLPITTREQDASPAEVKALMHKLATAQARMLENSEYVGATFADEARAMHDGDSAKRPIHGRATIEEAKALVADGVPVAPLPFPVRAPGQDN